MKLEISRQIFEKYPNINFIKIRQMGAELFHGDGQTDMPKPIIAFPNFANASKGSIINNTRALSRATFKL
jgi:hypothetical protein